ncbi:MAG TPA: glycoside hydrolase family 15 protein [Anaerohalosphaeraceae bacterium]|jgi:GH15 family glucan-1,4-alpha-glucosidase|nr:glycoside hydrolase family 15 protein [Anaerohalosphaeraceae bacterium]HRT51935.1 glycoside hydrolase family 15 protein [Anaerohalosphaeraceae bacterium]HRT88005.1 glycoside hydrolase family 15 protein [Anaerohalosphaeraceae bacterium]
MDNLNYGVIGNCRSAALVSDTGSVDWCCLPTFDSQSIFARILDAKNGGEFSIEPVGEYQIRQHYMPKTNILVTHFTNGMDTFEVRDFMPRYRMGTDDVHCPPEVIRYFRHISGRPEVVLNFNPKLNYGDGVTFTRLMPGGLKSVMRNGEYESLYLYTDLDARRILHREPIVLDDNAFVMISYYQKITMPTLEKIDLEFEKTRVYWMDWLARTTAPPASRRHIERSALVLKLLTYEKTGAVLAAVTTSLPETLGGVRNWDYRYCWIRDASMIVSILVRLNHRDMARRFLEFVLDVIPYKHEKIQIMYSIDGHKTLTERTLDWLSGYMDSRPVRVGNAAYKQKQNDIYGVLMDVIYQDLLNYTNIIDTYEELWSVVRTLVRHVRNNWQRPDRGIWEFRNDMKHFVFSKVLCWVAIDRGVKIARLLGKQADADDWAKLRDKIKNEVLSRGWNAELGCFTQYYGSDCLDASNLLMEHYGFITADDPRYVATVRKTYQELCVDGLMYRYKNHDGFGEPTSSFTVCTLWMIKSLNRIGEKRQAQEMFERLMGHANHVGLFSEDIDFKTKRLLGNFPQGYSHLAIIDAAMELYNGECDAVL